MSLPNQVVKWITDETGQEKKKTAPSAIEEIETEIEQLKSHTIVTNDTSNESSEIWLNGWKKYQGNWTPQPMGTYI